jgi:hypothetical protein
VSSKPVVFAIMGSSTDRTSLTLRGKQARCAINCHRWTFGRSGPSTVFAESCVSRVEKVMIGFKTKVLEYNIVYCTCRVVREMKISSCEWCLKSSHTYDILSAHMDMCGGANEKWQRVSDLVRVRVNPLSICVVEEEGSWKKNLGRDHRAQTEDGLGARPMESSPPHVSQPRQPPG